MKEKMKKKGIKRRLLIAVLSLVMVISVLPLPALDVHAADSLPGGLQCDKNPRITHMLYLGGGKELGQDGRNYYYKCTRYGYGADRVETPYYEYATGWVDEPREGAYYVISRDSGKYIECDGNDIILHQTHSFGYTLVGTNTIKATCNNSTDACGLGGDRSVSLTLTANNADYSGNTTFAGVSFSNTTAWTNTAKLSLPQIRYYKATQEGGTDGTEQVTNLSGLAVGNYYAAVTVDSVIAKVPFKINKATPTAGLFAYTAPSNLVYDGTAKSATVNPGSGVEGLGSITVKYYNSSDEEVTSPTDAGTYKVMVTTTAGDNYNEITTPLQVGEFTIAKADYNGTKVAEGDLPARVGGSVTIMLPELPDGASYGTVTNNNTGFFTVGTVSERKISVTSAKAWDSSTETANKTFTVQVTGAKNYNDYNITITVKPKFHEHTFTLAKQNNSIVATCTCGDNDSCDFNGKIGNDRKVSLALTAPSPSPTYSGNREGVSFNDTTGWNAAGLTVPTINYEGVAPTIYSLSEDAPTNAGTYKASITVTTTNSDGGVEEQTTSVEFTIQPKAILASDVTLMPNNTFVYDTYPKTVTVSVSSLTENTDYKVSGITEATALSTGNGYAVTVTGKGNYTGTVTKYWTITKEPITIHTAPTASAIDFGQTLSASILSGGNPDSTAGTWSWEEPNTKPDAIGTFTAKAKFTPNDPNYGPNTRDVTLTVNKSTPAAPNATAVAPTSSTATNGKITGVDDTMEYAVYDEEKGEYGSYKDVTGTEIPDLPAGTKVKVRVKATANNFDGVAKELTVPAYKAPSRGKGSASNTNDVKSAVELREDEEESMIVTIVTIDTTRYSINERTVVPGTSYNLSRFVTTKGIVKGIKTAVAAANKDKKNVAEIYTGKPFCFNRAIIRAIQEGKKTVVYYFVHNGHVYSVTIPATVDANKVLEKSGFAGPLYVGQRLGTTRLIK